MTGYGIVLLAIEVLASTKGKELRYPRRHVNDRVVYWGFTCISVPSIMFMKSQHRSRSRNRSVWNQSIIFQRIPEPH